MAILKCKMCGGTLEVTNNERLITCEFCGTIQTIPTLDNEKKTLLHNRANAFRLRNEFDKAIVTYESIVDEFVNDAEAYWGLVLCKYGIEYVDDPKTGKKIPTCHRTLTKNIFDDIDYQNAIKHSDVVSKYAYEKEAIEIDKLQKEIIVLSQKEEPYDIFICYKETDNLGKRTLDSVIAQDIYDELTKKGYKIFFSRITLESKLGSQYEPIIYAALSSSKAMLVIGTKPEYFNAVWVRNEWQRYIDMMHNGDAHKYLIPCYKDMDAYDLPEEMLSYQCQDLNKLGYMQDLTRGLDKIFGKDKVVIEQVPKRTLNAFGRIEMLLEQGDRNKAKEIIENLLNEDYTNSKAYLYSLIIELNLKKEIDLEKLDKPLTTYQNYQNAMKFASNDYKKVLESYNNKILENIENIKKEEIYKEADKDKRNQNYDYTIKLYSKIKDYKDSNKQIEICNEEIVNKKEKLYNESIKEAEKENYDKALSLLNKLQNYKDAKELYNKYVELKEKENIYRKAEYHAQEKTINCYTHAIYLLLKINNYKDSELLIEKYKEEIKKIKDKKAIQKDKTIKTFKISTLVSVILISLIILITSLIIPTINLNKARSLINEGSLTESEEILTNLDGFGDSENLLEILYVQELINESNFTQIKENLDKIGVNINIVYDTTGGILLEENGEIIASKDGNTFYGWTIEEYKFLCDKNNYLANFVLKANWKPYILDNDIIYFGEYPQSKVTNELLINNLSNITITNENGYIEYDGNEYKEYNDNYYLVEPIKWKILETNNNSYKLVSDLILDKQEFYSSFSSRTINGNTIYPNNYEYSNIRAWLNNDFINTAFNTEEKNIINESLVDNSASTTKENTNKYACNNTNDKVYLLSYKDVTEKYFTNSGERKAIVTDYAKDKGVYEYTGLGNFWLRSPIYFDNSYNVYYVNYYGSVFNDCCINSYIGARPALEIKIK